MEKEEFGDMIYEQKLFYCKKFIMNVRKCQMYGCSYFRNCEARMR
jgi:hypothetical protein